MSIYAIVGVLCVVIAAVLAVYWNLTEKKHDVAAWLGMLFSAAGSILCVYAAYLMNPWGG